MFFWELVSGYRCVEGGGGAYDFKTKILTLSITHVCPGCDSTGRTDLASLETALALQHRTGRRIIGCFSIASNVTGRIYSSLIPPQPIAP
jgi:hypothetical protein